MAYSIHCVQHALSNAISVHSIFIWSTVSRYHPLTNSTPRPIVCNSIHSHKYPLTNEQIHSSWCNSIPNYCVQIDPLQVLLQSPLHHGRQVHLQTIPISAPMWNSTLRQLQPPRVPNVVIQDHLKTCTIPTSNYISNLPQTWPPTVTPISLNQSLQWIWNIDCAQLMLAMDPCSQWGNSDLTAGMVLLGSNPV